MTKRSPSSMRPLPLALALLGLLLAPLTAATALTYTLAPNEKACFFAAVEQPGAKVAVYFAVQSGGSFDVDYTVTGPREHLIMAGNKERQGDFVFAAGEAGEHRVCFDNDMSTFTDKMVDFEITVSISRRGTCRASPMLRSIPPLYLGFQPHRRPIAERDRHSQVENEVRTPLPVKKGTTPEQTVGLEDSLNKLAGQLSTVARNQKYFRTRENRNFSTVRSTERRIWHFSVVESLTMVAMAGLQVFVVRFFFQGARKGYV